MKLDRDIYSLNVENNVKCMTHQLYVQEYVHKINNTSDYILYTQAPLLQLCTAFCH